jgi:hypothetical protein
VELEPSEERDWADLAALADGTLPEERRPEVVARVDASPALQEALARQRSALAEISAVADERAPEALRTWLDGQSRSEGALAGPRVRSPWFPRIAAAGLAAAVALAVVLSLAGGAPSTTELADQVAQTDTVDAQKVNPDGRGIGVDVDGVPFPDWGERLHWHANGARPISLDGRSGKSVRYESYGKVVDYAILARPALDLPAGEGTYRSFTYDGRRAVAWHRDGRTCLLLGDSQVDDATLRKLAESTRYY